MTRIIESRRRFKSRLDAKQDVSRPIPALEGDGNGNIDVPNQPGYVYIRTGNGDLGQAFNNRAPRADNLPIDVGYDPITDPDRRIFQVLSVRGGADYAGAGGTPYANVPSHHTTHEFGGGDDVFLSWRRLMGLRVGRPSGYSVTVDEGFILRAGAWLAVLAQTLDLTASKPALATQARYVLIALNAAGVATSTDGALVAVGALDISDCPIPAAGEIPLAAVRMYGTQMAIGDVPSAPDIIDLRFPQAASTGTVFLSSLQPGTAQYQIITSGANPYPATWSGFYVRGTAGGTTNLAVTNTKILTLTSADDYNLTAERTGAVIVRTATPNIVGSNTGNARGTNAVDLQLSRAFANQVASGAYSAVLGGRDSTASGDYSIAMGYGASAAGLESIAWGNGASADGDNSFAAGLNASTGANNGVFIWADSTAAVFNGIVTDEFALRARGGFRHAWDDANYWTAKVSAAGAVTFDAVGASAGFTFSKVVTLPAAGLVVTGMARGDILTGNAAPAFARLAKGAAYAVLTGDGTDTAWSTYLLSGTAGGKTTFAVTNAKTLTLTATDDYNLTIPESMTAAGRNVANAFTESNTIASGKFLTCLTDGNTGGLRAGSGSDVLWYRNAADTWRTPDHVVVDGQIGVGSGAYLGGVAGHSYNAKYIGSLADHGKTAIGIAVGEFALAFIACATTGTFAIYTLQGGVHATQEISDPSNKYTVTEDNDTTTNIYWDAGNAQYELNNELGVSANYHIWFMRVA